MTRDIGSFRGIHSGRTFILGNGPSLGDLDLSKLQEPTFGVNRSFKVHTSQYHVASDELTFREHRADLRITPRHVFATDGRFPEEDRHWVVVLKNLGDAIGWSWALGGGGQDLHPQGVYPRFSTYVAMQLAVYMGFTDIVLLGTDLVARGKGSEERGHFFSAGPLDNPWIGDARFQSECFGYAAGVLSHARFHKVGNDIRVRIVSDACPLRCFEKVKFEEVVG